MILNDLRRMVYLVSDFSLQRSAYQCLPALKPMLDDNNTLSRAAETKAVLKDLQDDLSNCTSLTGYG